VLGGNSDDNLTLKIITALDDNSIDALLDGGGLRHLRPNAERRSAEL
jgi:hypothetical protein